MSANKGGSPVLGFLGRLGEQKPALQRQQQRKRLVLLA